MNWVKYIQIFPETVRGKTFSIFGMSNLHQINFQLDFGKKEENEDFFNNILPSAMIINKQNCRIWREESLHHQRVTVWCGIWTICVISSHFFENEVSKVVGVQSFVWFELEGMDVQHMWFQQLTANETHYLLQEQF